MSQKKRRRWSADEKLRIVLAGLEPGVEVSELCRREGINPTQYYGWKNTLLSRFAECYNEHCAYLARIPTADLQRPAPENHTIDLPAIVCRNDLGRGLFTSFVRQAA